MSHKVKSRDAQQRATHLLIVRLFFLDPNNPCMTMMGDVCLSTAGFAGSCKSYASGTVENGDEVRAPAVSGLMDTGAEPGVGARIRRAQPEHTCRKADADDVRPIIILADAKCKMRVLSNAKLHQMQ